MEFELYFHTMACLVVRTRENDLWLSMDEMTDKVVKGLSLEKFQRNCPE